MKRWLWKKTLMVLSALVWRLDEWVHAQQLQLRRDSDSEKFRGVSHHREAAGGEANRLVALRQPKPLTPVRRTETFDQWTARRAGVAPASKAEARRHRERLAAAVFDRRFA